MPSAEMALLTAEASLLTAEEAFEGQLDQWVLDAVTGGHMTFEAVLRTLPGVYPAVALHSIERLAKRGQLPRHVADRAAASAGRMPEPKGYNDASCLPLPHPLDFEWRFSAGALELLWQNVLELSQGSDTIALLGTPSLFQWARKRRENQRRCVLVDSNRPAVISLSQSVHSGSVICCDIAHGRLPALTAQVVVIDPPWYPVHVRTFLRAASQTCTVGGHVLLSAPPAGTRPGIREEWEETLELAEGMGLRLKRSEPSVLPHATPPFERNALRAAGVSSYPAEWRRGDLAVFLRYGQASHRSPPLLCHSPPSPPSPCPEWAEESVEGVRIRMRSQEHSRGDPRLVSLVTGDVLPSVSRRDERRRLADVWTSGNRIFRCADTAILRQVCRAVARGEAVAAYVAGALRRKLTPEEMWLVADAGEQLRQLVRTERGELDRYGW